MKFFSKILSKIMMTSSFWTGVESELLELLLKLTVRKLFWLQWSLICHYFEVDFHAINFENIWLLPASLYFTHQVVFFCYWTYPAKAGEVL